MVDDWGLKREQMLLIVCAYLHLLNLHFLGLLLLFVDDLLVEGLLLILSHKNGALCAIFLQDHLGCSIIDACLPRGSVYRELVFCD